MELLELLGLVGFIWEVFTRNKGFPLRFTREDFSMEPFTTGGQLENLGPNALGALPV